MFRFLNYIGFLLTLSLSPINSFTVNFELESSGNQIYSTSYDNNYIIDNFSNNNLCEEYCTIDPKCNGYFTNNTSCNTLSYLGDIVESDTPGNSYKKVITYDEELNSESTLKLYIFDYYNNFSYNSDINSSVYFDFNRNGIHDDNNLFLIFMKHTKNSSTII